MRYYKNEYLDMINSINPREREEGENKWNSADKEYSIYFASIKGYLPQKYLDKYCKYCGFHDFEILSVSILCNEIGESTVELKLTFNNKVYKISYNKVENFIYNLPDGHTFNQNKLVWQYDELILEKNGCWSNCILCSRDCEIKILFKDLEFAEIF